MRLILLQRQSHYLIAYFYRTDKVNDFAIGVQLFKFITSPRSLVTIDVAGSVSGMPAPAAQMGRAAQSMIVTHSSMRGDEDVLFCFF